MVKKAPPKVSLASLGQRFNQLEEVLGIVANKIGAGKPPSAAKGEDMVVEVAEKDKDKWPYTLYVDIPFKEEYQANEMAEVRTKLLAICGEGYCRCCYGWGHDAMHCATKSRMDAWTRKREMRRYWGDMKYKNWYSTIEQKQVTPTDLSNMKRYVKRSLKWKPWRK